MSSSPTEPATPADSPLRLVDVMSSPFYRGLMTPTVEPGNLAPDFDLPRLDDRGRVRLADFRGERPVALVFGSYT